MTLADDITVLIPTSPIPSHPSTEIIDATIDSIAAAGLGECWTVIMCDGVRPEQEDRRDDYEAYLARLAGRTLYASPRVPTRIRGLLFHEYLHQAEMTRRALATVETPCILFVEHDTPLVGEIPWASMVAAIRSGEADVIRLHHEAHVLREHRYLMRGRERVNVHGVPLWATGQWSQRPHLASTDWYRAMLDRYFPGHARTFIEDRLYGEVATPWVERREWGEVCKLWLYAPYEGTWKRSEHLDGRAGERKYEMTW